MKRCLFGGSFDPVHLGHIEIAQRAKALCGLDQVVFLPAAQSPLKAKSPVATGDQRLEMLRLALEGLDWAVIDGIDLELPPPSWSWRIAEHFKKKYPDGSLYWLMGADQWNDLEKWGRWDYLSSMVTYIVHHRDEKLIDRPAVNAIFIEGHHPASSSELRRKLSCGESVPSGWINEKVEGYILENGLYSGKCRGRFS